MIKRLRPAYSPEELAEIYEKEYNHTRWPDHIERVKFTKSFIRDVMIDRNIRTVADLSCGDGAIALGIGAEEWFLGDLTPGEHCGFHGPIEQTIEQIPQVDLFILSETLEHVDDPAGLLAKIWDKADCLVLTTPLGEVDDGNPEHYWGWDLDGIESLLEDALWWPDHSVLFTPDVEDVYYTYQVWMATHDAP